MVDSGVDLGADLVSLARTPPVVANVVRDDLHFTLEPFAGVTKLQYRGDAAAGPLRAVLGVDLPAPLRTVAVGDVDVAWLAPGEWLLVGDEAAVAALVDRIATALSGTLFLATDLTHARAVFTLSGRSARDVLAAHCPLDLSDTAFPVGATARSLLADTGLFVQRPGDSGGTPTFRVIVDQSMAAYAVRMIAGPDGVGQ